MPPCGIRTNKMTAITQLGVLLFARYRKDIYFQQHTAIVIYVVAIWVAKLHLCSIINCGLVIKTFSKILNTVLETTAKSFENFLLYTSSKHYFLLTVLCASSRSLKNMIVIMYSLFYKLRNARLTSRFWWSTWRTPALCTIIDNERCWICC